MRFYYCLQKNFYASLVLIFFSSIFVILNLACDTQESKPGNIVYPKKQSLTKANEDKTMSPEEQEFFSMRKRMVEYQLQGRDITDPKVIAAMLSVKRHLFVSKEIMHMAYEDRPLPIGYDQTISQPYIVAFMTQVLDLKGDEKVLEIGTGSGYQAAILAEIVKEVYTIEIVKPLGERAEKLLLELGYKNIHVKIGDGYEGWKEHAPFDAIIVTCSPDHIPVPLQEQLKVGGRMIIPVGDPCHGQELILLEKESQDHLIKKSVMDVRFVPMRGKAEEK